MRTQLSSLINAEITRIERHPERPGDLVFFGIRTDRGVEAPLLRVPEDWLFDGEGNFFEDDLDDLAADQEAIKKAQAKIADHVDGYDRDDLGESAD